MTPLLRLRGVGKAYGGRPVLGGLDLDVPTGQTVSLIGPSGSGKSTLLRLIMTLDRPDAGTLEIDGASPWEMTRDGRRLAADGAHLRRVRGQVGMVFQHFNLFPHMTALGNVTEGPRQVLGLRADEATHRAAALLERVGLGSHLHHYPAQLSGGQKQRVAIARALAMGPRILLLDEITSALDPELVAGVLDLVRELAAERSMTLLIVTHHMRFAEHAADRVLFFDEGRILEDAPPAILFRAPTHERTRRFLASLLAADA